MAKLVSIEVICPNNRKSLMDRDTLLHERPTIKLNIQNGTNYGTVRLCSVYDCYDQISDITINDGEIVRFFCPDCNQELKGNMTCELCGAPLISLPIKMGGKVMFCSRKGCKNHFVAFADLSTEIKKFYEEYGN